MCSDLCSILHAKEIYSKVKDATSQTHFVVVVERKKHGANELFKGERERTREGS